VPYDPGVNTTATTPPRTGPRIGRTEATECPVVFVYGTLKKGNRNAGRLDGSIPLGTASTPARFSLFCLGYAPGMVTGGSTAVRGECYVVTGETLATLDAFEGHPWKYRRTLLPLTLDDGTELYAWVYLLRRDYVAADGGRIVPSGAWEQPEDSGAVALARLFGRGGRRIRGGSSRTRHPDPYGGLLDDLAADEAEALAFGYCPDCGDVLDVSGSCLLCDPSRTREAIERWARDA
jgi:gamma-glutamylcyclotransferase (GGCT)/AIG2-like uncharacterized protein YtfP